MARLHLGFAALAVLAGWATPALGASSSPVDGSPAPVAQQEVPDVPDGRRSYAQSAYTKLRPGYNLGGPDQVPPAQDSRGEWGVRRDTLLQQHYRHMAELDVLSDAAVRNHDISSAERAEALRRRHNQRFMLNMQNLRRLLLKQQAEWGP